MKIAISSTGKTEEDYVDARFGRCSYFSIVEIEEEKIKSIKYIENTSSQQASGVGISAAQLVADQEVESIITVNLGPRAFDVFTQLNIKIYKGQGKIKEVIQQFINGKLQEMTASTKPMHGGRY